MIGLANWLSWLGGADTAVLAKVPARERDRYAQMGLVLLTTATLAVVSMSFALVYGVKVGASAPGARGSFWVAVPFAVLWGLIILNLDRFLILNMGTSRSIGQLAAMAAPRVAMAAVLAVVISTPLVLQVFASDITAKMSELQLAASAKQKQQVAESNWAGRVKDLQRQIAEREDIVAGNLPTTFTTPALDTLRDKATEAEHKVADLQKASDVAEEAWKCERAGAGRKCRGATSQPGQGTVANEKEKQFARAQRALADAQDRLDDAEKALRAEERKVIANADTELKSQQARARRELPALRTQLAGAQTKLDHEQDDGEEAIAADTGILAQLRALSAISETNSMLRWAHRFVAALFFLIEILPVAVKVLLSLGKPTEYDNEVESEEEARAAEREKLRDKIKTSRAEARQVEEDKSQTRVTLEKDMRGHEQDIGRRANALVAQQMESIVQDALKQWSDDVRTQLGSNGTGPAVNGTQSSPFDGTTGPRRTRRFTKEGQRAHRQQQAADAGYDLPPVDQL